MMIYDALSKTYSPIINRDEKVHQGECSQSMDDSLKLLTAQKYVGPPAQQAEQLRSMNLRVVGSIPRGWAQISER